MKKIIVAAYSLFTLATLNGQVEQQSLPGAEEISNRRTSFNLEEIKVRWKKAALENCTGAPCTGGTGGSFTCGTSTVADIDGNTYNTVLIGTQCWTKSNLKVTKYIDGTLIPLDASGGTGGRSAGWNSGTGAYTIYGNGTSSGTNATNYGFLYNGYAATDSRKLCPIGWHVPTDSDWNKLVISSHSGTTSADTSSTSSTQSRTAGTVMKSTVTNTSSGSGVGWDPWSPPSPGTNTSGFSALPGGYRFRNGDFSSIWEYAFFWSATEYGTDITKAWQRFLSHENGDVYRGFDFKSLGASVRCLKD